MPRKAQSEDSKARKKRGQGEGSIRKRKDGTWEARYTIGRDANGKQIQKSVYAKSRYEVKAKLNKALHELDSGLYVEPSQITLKSWIKTWLNEYKKKSVKPKTYQTYEILSNTHINPEIGHYTLKDLRPDHIQSLINRKLESGLSIRSVRYIHTTIHNALAQALKNGLIIRNVANAVTLPKQIKQQIEVFTVEEQKAFMDAIQNDRLKPAFIVELCTGLRIGELLALTWDDIDFEKGLIRVNKNIQRVKNYNGEQKTKLIISESPKTEAGVRIVPLMKTALNALKEQKRRQAEEKLKAGALYTNNNIVFATALGSYIDPRNLLRSYTKILKANNIRKLSFHALRHTFATRALEQNIPPKVVQDILGHSSIKMTLDLYSHVLPNTKKEAMDRLNDVFEG